MLKKDVLGAASAKSLEDTFKCGECLHFATTCHSARDAVCSKLGVRAFALAPKCFTPNVAALFGNAEQFVVLSSILNGYNTKQRRILLGLLRGNKTTSGNPKYRFGTKLYIKMGQDVLNSYYCGYVVGYTSSGEIILCGNADRKSAGRSFFAYLKTTDDLLTSKEWKVKKQELIASGRISSTRTRGTPAHLEKYLNYEVPTIDTNPDLFDPPAKKKSRRRQDVTEFMVS